MRLKDIGETEIIKRIEKRFSPSGPRAVLGIGDDAAVLRIDGRKLCLITTDMLVEGTHFIPGTISFYDLGYKALAVNLSDIAAMGGTPLHALVSLGLSPDTALKELDAFYDGLQELAKMFAVDVVGGDMTSNRQGMVINITVTGETENEHLVLQSGAREGDLIAVTGEVGASDAGLKILLNSQVDFPPLARNTALSKHYRPFPRVREGRELARTGRVHAMKDISDGLAKEVNTIALSSGKMAVLYADKIPLSPCVLDVAGILKLDALEMALRGGEDYELVFTFAADDFHTISKISLNYGFPMHIIGEIHAGEGVFLESQGQRKRLLPEGYEHF